MSLGMRRAVEARASRREKMFMAAKPVLFRSLSSCSGLPLPPVSLGKMICLVAQIRMTKATRK